MIPSLGSLQVLAELTRHGSLTAAAGRLGVSRSALSHRIADLEAQLGASLVRKSGRRLVLTDEGEVLMASIGDAVDRIEAAITPFRRRQLQVRISTVATFASLWLIPRLPDFQSLHPDVEVAISTTARAVDLASEDIDLAIRHGHGKWSGLTASLLFRETLLPVAAPAYLGHVARRSFETSPGVTLIHARSREHDWTQWWKQAARAPASNRKLFVETRAQALDAALAGSGIAMMDAAYIEPLIVDGRLRSLAAAPIQLETGYYIVHRPTPRNSRSVFALRDWALANAHDG